MNARTIALATLATLSTFSTFSTGVAFAAPAAVERTNLQILDDVSTAVNRYVDFTIFDDVSARVQHGVVTLTGRVTLPYKRDALAARVARVEGVAQVQNDIQVLPVSQFDDQLRARIARAIYRDLNFVHMTAMANPPIHIVVERGQVRLTGVVQSEVDRAIARALATQFGAFTVTNELKTAAEAREAREHIA